MFGWRNSCDTITHGCVNIHWAQFVLWGKLQSNLTNISNIALNINNQKSFYFSRQELSRILFVFMDSANTAIIFCVLECQKITFAVVPLKEICQKVCASHDRVAGQWASWQFIKVEITINSFEKWFGIVTRNCGGDLTVPGAVG